MFLYALWRDLVSDAGAGMLRQQPTGEFLYALWRDLVSDGNVEDVRAAFEGFYTPCGVTLFRTNAANHQV